MRVYYFWYAAWPRALAALPPDAGHVWTGPGTDGYWRTFAQRWTGEDDLVCVEQDVLIHAGVLPQFAACPQPWCAFGWEVGPGQMSYWWLGCTKFSAALQAAVPLTSKQPGECARCGPVPCHRHMDVILHPVMAYLGQEQPHTHTPPVTHLRAA